MNGFSEDPTPAGIAIVAEMLKRLRELVPPVSGDPERDWAVWCAKANVLRVSHLLFTFPFSLNFHRMHCGHA